jgi:hypothetical protein
MAGEGANRDGSARVQLLELAIGTRAAGRPQRAGHQAMAMSGIPELACSTGVLPSFLRGANRRSATFRQRDLG